MEVTIVKTTLLWGENDPKAPATQNLPAFPRVEGMDHLGTLLWRHTSSIRDAVPTASINGSEWNGDHMYTILVFEGNHEVPTKNWEMSEMMLPSAH